ncbi:hypothetical protein GTQ43_20800 [Nostoc sp. KVJ3]|uniref:hypothetical protein n=1 Tax=Nostoc sp. KVJ3 TaxID=457945 RepID=UPI002237127D|nr:hypothetical protein [Nostoc sp. KVJ3]MCW5316164.1 hypothetical protein [Nostoc sp. KVJ3]
MLSINQLLQSSDDDEHEIIELRIGQRIKYYDNKGGISHGEVIEADVVGETVTVITGNIIKYKEVVDINDLIEG